MKHIQTALWVAGLLFLTILATAFLRPDNFDLPESNTGNDAQVSEQSGSERTVLETEGQKHSIPLSEILSGGPGKDGIPSIDSPQFETKDTTNLSDETIGIGIEIDGDARFYAYNILVWHEIVNDTIGNTAVAVTYCPLCGTGIAFDRNIDGKVYEFGVSGLLWQSNLLMYNRTGNPETESLWSQILGEAVVGELTGTRLAHVPGDTTRLSDWIEKFPDSKILSTNTGAVRNYGRDPYGDYYSNESVSFGATFMDDRLHPKELIQGIEIDGMFKAYKDSDITTEKITDIFAGKEIRLQRNTAGQITVTADGERIEPIRSFWFSWVAVHADSELFIK